MIIIEQLFICKLHIIYILRKSMNDILFKTEEYIFSYRVAGIAIQNKKVLLQKPINDNGFAFPGGHVSFGETNEETLLREFKEEINAKIKVNDLKWIGELFFPWGNKPCHQICLYYLIDILDESTPKDGMFYANESLSGENMKLEFHWIPISDFSRIDVYPLNVKELIKSINDGPKHFIYKET
jgi:ADP-ribose pyrophosphatase YjhB (NUDIX family)